MTPIVFDQFKPLFKSDADYDKFVGILKQGAKDNAIVMNGGKVLGSLTQYKSMKMVVESCVPNQPVKPFDFARFATRIRSAYPSCSACEVRFVDDDGALKLKVYSTTGNTLAEWDTGEDGNEPVSQALFDIEAKLTAELVKNRFTIVANEED